ncbi:hypothetical protein MMC19_001473 [Ptychographa xylographoides]|nr:hypothetical protein [Ptychographa xylographoides]
MVVTREAEQRKRSIIGPDTEPKMNEGYDQMTRRPSAAEVKAMARNKNAVSDKRVTGASQITVRQSIVPVMLVTILFFLWGFAYGLLDVLNSHFQTTLGVTKAQGAGLSGAYFGAYFLAPLTFAGYIVRRFGYRWTFITGLCIFGVGALMFWPSGVKRSFPGFVGSMFIVGSGLSTLETSANPYIATCGPPRYSDIRLNLSQSFQAIGSVVAPLLAAQVFFKDVNDNSLTSVQYTYLAVACFVFLLAVVFYFAPIPEITDADMADGEEQGREYETGYQDKPLYKQYTLFWGVAAQFCYVGSQVAIANFFINYVQQVKPGTSQSTGSNLLAVAQSLFAIGRFASSLCMKFLKPRQVLWLFNTMILIFIICAITLSGNAGVATLSLVLLFESCIFPTIFTLSLRGLGRHTKRGASFIVSSVCGGAVFPPILGVVADARNTQLAMVIPLVGFIVAWSFPMYLNLFKAEMLDGYSSSKVGIEAGRTLSVVVGGGRLGQSLDEEKSAGRASFHETVSKEELKQ